MLQIAVEEIAKACASSALILMVQELGTLPIQLFGTDEQKERLLPRCATGEWSPAFCLSEPEAGSDPASMRTTAVPRRRRVGHQRHRRTGSRTPAIADFYVVFAVTDRENRAHERVRRREGPRRASRVGKLEHKLGIKGSPTGSPVFEDVRVPAGEHDRRGRARGCRSRSARSSARAWAPPRRRSASRRARPTTPTTTPRSAIAFGKPINELQGIQFKLADMETRTAAARELLYKACAMADRNEPRPRQVHVDGEAVRLRHRDVGDRRGGPGARRLRLRHRVPGRAHDARREDHPDLRGHERDPAARDRARTMR